MNAWHYLTLASIILLTLWRWLRPGRIEGEFERMGRVKKGMNKR